MDVQPSSEYDATTKSIEDTLSQSQSTTLASSKDPALISNATNNEVNEDGEEEEEEKLDDDDDYSQNLTTDNDPTLRASAVASISTTSNMPPVKADLTILCTICDYFIDMRSLPSHKHLHRCLDVMQYKFNKRPLTVHALVKQRQVLLKRVKEKATKTSPIDPLEIQRINNAYEFIKADIEDSYETLRQIRDHKYHDVRGVALNCSPDCALAIGMCNDGNERWKSEMEDAKVYQDFFGNDPHKAFFAIYDGHHGRFAAEIAANELHHSLLNQMCRFDPRTKCTCTFNMAEENDISEYEIHSRPQTGMTERSEIHESSTNLIQQIIHTCEGKVKFLELEDKNGGQGKTDPGVVKETPRTSSKCNDPFSQKMAHAFTKAHKYTDQILAWGKDECSKVRWSGCSTLTCVIRDKKEDDEQSPVTEKPEIIAEDQIDEPSSAADLEPRELGTLHLANAGNVQAVLVRANVAYRLSKIHTPHANKEKSRVISKDGVVSKSKKKMLVNGVLATTRGLGNHGDPALKKCVISDPYTVSLPIDQHAQFLIFASNGVWEVLSEEEAASLLFQVLPSNHLRSTSDVGSSVLGLLRPAPSAPSMPSTARGLAMSTMSSERLINIRSRGSAKPKDETETSGPTLEFQPPTPTVNSETGIDTLHDLVTEIGSKEPSLYDGESGVEADIESLTTMTIPREEEEPPKPEDVRAGIQRDYARFMAERLVESALLAGAKDNITVMVVLLPGSGL